MRQVMLLWNKTHATGSSTIDQHHQMLMDNINHLERMLTSTNPTAEECKLLIQLVDFLESYADMHFKFEEECMERFRCPAHQKNKEGHAQFREFFRRFKERHTTEGFRPEVLKDLHAMASAWIQTHILQVDLQLRPCIKAGALRQSSVL